MFGHGGRRWSVILCNCRGKFQIRLFGAAKVYDATTTTNFVFAFPDFVSRVLEEYAEKASPARTRRTSSARDKAQRLDLSLNRGDSGVRPRLERQISKRIGITALRFFSRDWVDPQRKVHQICVFAQWLSIPTFPREHIHLCINLSKPSLRIVQAIEKLQKRFLIKFTETNMHIICNSDGNKGGIQVWSCVLFCISYATHLTSVLGKSNWILYSQTTVSNTMRTKKSRWFFFPRLYWLR